MSTLDALHEAVKYYKFSIFYMPTFKLTLQYTCTNYQHCQTFTIKNK